MKQLSLFLFITFSIGLYSQNNKEKIVGNHLLALQWISWKDFGSAKITKSDEPNTYKIEGVQNSKENNDFLKISGTLTYINDRHLVFNGTIETSVSFLNEGKPCLRNGEFNFEITGKRKYWRLQESDNPCDKVTDYVDIFL